MLKPKYLEQLPDAMIDLYSEVEMELLADMARRISKCDYWSPATEWQRQKLSERDVYKRQKVHLRHLKCTLFFGEAM